MRAYAIMLFLCTLAVVSSAWAVSAPIHDAAGKGDIPEVTSLLMADPSLVNATDKNGAAPLHYAVAAGQVGVVQLLLDKNADVNAAKKDGVTALHIAASLGHLKIAELLIARNVDLEAKDQLGRTPLSLAQEKGNKEVADLLQTAIAARAEASGTHITCESLKEANPRGKWLTIADSRLVVNPTLNSQQPLPKELMPSLPMQIGYYVGEEPVRLPMFWMWQPGGREDMHPKITYGPIIDLSEAGRDQWKVEGMNAAFTDAGARVSLTGTDSVFNWGVMTSRMTVDLDKTPYACVNVASLDDKWSMQVRADDKSESKDLVQTTYQPGSVVADVSAATGWSGKKTFQIRLYDTGKSGSTALFDRLAFLGLGGSAPTFTKDSLEWYPHKLVEYGSCSQLWMKVRTVTQFMDESSILQSLLVTEGDNERLVLIGNSPYGNARWSYAEQGVVLQADGFSAVIRFGRPAKWLGAYPSWIDWLEDRPSSNGSGGIWAVQFDGLKKDDSIVVATRFGTDARSPETMLGEIRQAVEPGKFGEILKQQRDSWESLLAEVPHPMDFGLHLVETYGTTSDAIRRMYYKAWAFLLSDSLPAMPGNGFSFPQLACGKPSLWREGHPKARPSSQWESFIAMQLTAGIDPETAWHAYQGMMSLVEDNGVMKGEGLPARHCQAAWALYAMTGDKTRLRSIYSSMKGLMLWKAADPRWHYGSSTAPDTKDAGFVIHALMDMVYARRIAGVLGMPEEESFWRETITKLYLDYIRWFWNTPDGKPVRVYHADTAKSEDPGERAHITAMVLPPDVLKDDIKNNLDTAFPAIFDKSMPSLMEFWRGYPGFSHEMRGLWQDGFTREAAMTAEGAMRGTTMAGEFSEGCSGWPPSPGGVTPEVFGAALVIEGALWHNGVIPSDGLPIIAHVPNAVGVENLKLRTGTISTKFDQSGDGLEIWGNGLKGLHVPPGFEVGTHSDGTISWKGKLPVGQQVKLEEIPP